MAGEKMTVRLAVQALGGNLMKVDFCKSDNLDIAEVLHKQGVSTSNDKIYLNGEPANLTDTVRHMDLITLQKKSTKSG